MLVELKARFDEANNITWARQLESFGVHVAYGSANFKTHTKIAMVVRREADGIRRYIHARADWIIRRRGGGGDDHPQ